MSQSTTPVPMKQLLEWKERFGSIFHTRTPNGEYFFRALKKKEYDFLVGLSGSTDYDAEDMLLSLGLLYPIYDKGTFDQMLAGEVESVLSAINQKSGFSGTEDVVRDIETARGSLGNLENQIAILVCKAFPHLTLEDINNLTYEELIRYLSVSEAILDVKLKVEKPEQQKSGAIDFDAENKGIEDAKPFGKPPQTKPRGDVGK